MYSTHTPSLHALPQDTYGLKRVTAPFEEPISVAEAKDQLRLETSADDDKIARLIRTATDRCEAELGRSFCTQTWRLTLDRFPRRYLRLPRPPLVAVTSVKYYDTSNVLQTLDPAFYEADAESDPGRLALDILHYWPATYVRTNAVQVTYTAGYGAPSSVPERIRHAIAMLTAHWYENAEIVVFGRVNPLPNAVEALLHTASPGTY